MCCVTHTSKSGSSSSLRDKSSKGFMYIIEFLLLGPLSIICGALSRLSIALLHISTLFPLVPSSRLSPGSLFGRQLSLLLHSPNSSLPLNCMSPYSFLVLIPSTSSRLSLQSNTSKLNSERSTITSMLLFSKMEAGTWV